MMNSSSPQVIGNDVICDKGEYIPLSSEFFEDLPAPELAMVGVVGVLTVATLIVFGENVHFLLHDHQNEWLDRRASLWILSIVPVTSMCSAVALCLPRSALTADLVASIVFALGMLHFVMELIDYFGHANRAVTALRSEKIPIGSPPLCCFHCCCPVFKVNETTLRLCLVCVLQPTVLQPLAFLLQTLMAEETVYYSGRMKTNDAVICLTALKVVSTMVGVYGLSLVVSATEPVSDLLDIGPKHVILKLWLILTNLQALVFTLLESHDIPPCVGRLSSPVRGRAIHSMIMAVEMTLLAIVVRYLYHCSKDTSIHKETSHDLGNLSHSPGQGTRSSMKGSVRFKEKDAYNELEPIPSEFTDSSQSLTDSSVVSETSGRSTGLGNKSVSKEYGTINNQRTP